MLLAYGLGFMALGVVFLYLFHGLGHMGQHFWFFLWFMVCGSCFLLLFMFFELPEHPW